MQKTLAIIAIFYITHTLCATPDLVIAAFRHRARAPMSPAYDILKQWEGQYTELTSYGQRMLYMLGAAYRRNYPHLLEPYDPRTVHVRATSTRDTMMSATSFVLGIYNGIGPALGEAYPTDLGVPLYTKEWVKQIEAELASSSHVFNKTSINVKIDVVKPSQDKILQALPVNCPEAHHWINENGKTAQANSFYHTHMKDLLQYLKVKNITVNSLSDLYFFGDVAITNKFAGIPIPGDITIDSQHWRDASFASEWVLTNEYIGQDIQKQLGGVNFFANVLHIMDQVTKGEFPLKFVLYSTEDIVLLPVLAALGLVDNECTLLNYLAEKVGREIPYPNCIFPAYTANIKFELYGGKDPYVKVFYNDKAVGICDDVTECNLVDFTAYISRVTNHYTTEDFETLCNGK